MGTMIEVLLVDDEAYVTESLERTIPWTALGVDHVWRAASGYEAMRLLEEQSIDIVVTDIRMPGMDGLQLLEQIGERWPHIRAILLTGHSDFEYAKRALQLQACNYLLKPVDDGELIAAATSAIEALKDEWEHADKYQRLVYSRKSDLGVLRASLLHDLLLGRQLTARLLDDKLEQYEISVACGSQAALLFIQLGKQFTSMDHPSVMLMEYAIGNMAEEVFGAHFAVWHGRAPHDGMVIIAAPKSGAWLEQAAPQAQAEQTGQTGQTNVRAALEQHVRVLRRNVSNYLKGDMFVAVTPCFHFPDELPLAYRSALTATLLVEQGDAHSVIFLQDEEPGSRSTFRSLEHLYKPPTLIHLLESRQWEAAEQKMTDVFDDLRGIAYSKEHLSEVYFSLTSSFMYLTHTQGQYMYQLDQTAGDMLLDPSLAHSMQRLRDWSFLMLRKLQAELSSSETTTKSYIIRQVHEIVDNELAHDISVKTIADRVYLHPVYLSKMYKSETGESLGDYMIRKRMERAHYLLKHTNKKIYEITAELGYQNPQYFSKMFKKHYGMTPNEFRD